MKISGVQKTTTIDYPGKIACVVFTLGCNFRCPFCHNPESVLPAEIAKIKDDLIPEGAFFNFLEDRKGKLDGVSICGGEPTIQPDLYEFAKKIKDMGYLVKLDTNGRDAEIVDKMIQDGILDYVAVDIKHSMKKHSIATGTDETHDFFDNYEKLKHILLDGNVDYEYRTTIVKGMHTMEDIKSMAQHIKGAKNYYLQNYVAGNTLDPDFKGDKFDDLELEEMQKVAEEFVEYCGIRK